MIKDDVLLLKMSFLSSIFLSFEGHSWWKSPKKSTWPGPCVCVHKSISLNDTLLLKRETRDNNAFLIYCSLERETQRSCTFWGNVPVALLLRSHDTEADDQRYRLGWRKKKILQDATVKTQFLITNLWPSVKFKLDWLGGQILLLSKWSIFSKEKGTHWPTVVVLLLILSSWWWE